MSLSIVILAAGRGTRMNSDHPKVLHCAAGQPLLQHVIQTAQQVQHNQLVVVVGFGADQVISEFRHESLTFVHQHEQLGTGHAVQQCKDCLIQGDDVLVLYGDVPLITDKTLKLLTEHVSSLAVRVLSFKPINNQGYGRIVRDSTGKFIAIREDKDCSEVEQEIMECNSGIVWINGLHLKGLLEQITNKNAQGEFYLTDIVEHAINSGLEVETVVCEDEAEVLGVNNQTQLAQVESVFRARKAKSLMEQGVKLVDPNRIDIRGYLKVSKDVVIDCNCIFEGEVTLEEGVSVGANCVIKDSYIGKNTHIQPFSMIDSSRIGEKVQIGPMARIRPESEIHDQARIGNFVEIKKSKIGFGSKVSHLSYIGDTTMGGDVNVGAGCITCNYDGKNKHTTKIGDRVFLGSDSQLVAPVQIGDDATIGAGSTITKDAPNGELSLSRSKQITLRGWVKPEKR